MSINRRNIGWLFCLILLLESCSNNAPYDAVIVPSDQESAGCEIFAAGTAANAIVGACQTTGPVQFQVQRSADDPTPVSNADVRISIGNSAGDGVLLLNETGKYCYNGGDPTVPDSDCFSLTGKTDKFGTVKFQILTYPIFGCGAVTDDITSSSNVTVSISASQGTWHMDTTVKCS